MSEWTSKKLSDIVLINPKETLKKGSIAPKISMDILQPFCRDIPSYELAEYNGGAKFRNGDTIMARITPCLENGKTAKVGILAKNEIGFGSTEYIVFRAIDGITDEDFVYYLVCSPIIRNPAIKSMVGSSGRQRVQIDVLQSLVVSIPDLLTQRKIGSILKSIDDKIAINSAINENLLWQIIVGRIVFIVLLLIRLFRRSSVSEEAYLLYSVVCRFLHNYFVLWNLMVKQAFQNIPVCFC